MIWVLGKVKKNSSGTGIEEETEFFSWYFWQRNVGMGIGLKSRIALIPCQE